MPADANRNFHPFPSLSTLIWWHGMRRLAASINGAEKIHSLIRLLLVGAYSCHTPWRLSLELLLIVSTLLVEMLHVSRVGKIGFWIDPYRVWVLLGWVKKSKLKTDSNLFVRIFHFLG